MKDAEALSWKKIESAVKTTYPPAVADKGFETAHSEMQKELIRGFVVVKRGGIPAERARYFVEWQEYEYRGVLVHLDDNGKITTRGGKIYTYLQNGDVLGVVDMKTFGNAVYLRLITPEVYVPVGANKEKHNSRVTVMLGFKFPKDVAKNDDADAAILAMKEWIVPFGDYDEAVAYSASIKGVQYKKAVVEEEKVLEKSEEAVAESKGGGAKAAEEVRMKALEDKIENARKEMEEASKQMQELKKDMKK